MSWQLTNKDIQVLVKMLGGDVLVGFPNPFSSEREVEEERKNTFQKLHRRNLVNYKNGELTFEENFIQALWVVMKSNLITEFLRTKKDRVFFYFGDDQVVECRNLDGTKYEVDVHGPPTLAWQQVILRRMLLGVDDHPVRSEEPAMKSVILSTG